MAGMEQRQIQYLREPTDRIQEENLVAEENNEFSSEHA